MRRRGRAGGPRAVLCLERPHRRAEERAEPTGTKRDPEYVTGCGEAALERFSRHPVDEQAIVFGSDVDLRLRQHLLAMGFADRPAHPPVVVDERTQRLPGPVTREIEQRFRPVGAQDGAGLAAGVFLGHDVILV